MTEQFHYYGKYLFKRNENILCSDKDLYKIVYNIIHNSPKWK